jgi:hypothetical protein
MPVVSQLVACLQCVSISSYLPWPSALPVLDTCADCLFTAQRYLDASTATATTTTSIPHRFLHTHHHLHHVFCLKVEVVDDAELIKVPQAALIPALIPAVIPAALLASRSSLLAQPRYLEPRH